MVYKHEENELPEAERNTANGASAKHEIKGATDFLQSVLESSDVFSAICLCDRNVRVCSIYC